VDSEGKLVLGYIFIFSAVRKSQDCKERRRRFVGESSRGRLKYSGEMRRYICPNHRKDLAQLESTHSENLSFWQVTLSTRVALHKIGGHFQSKVTSIRKRICHMHISGDYQCSIYANYYYY
jgi:hypothetical protein